MSGLVESYLTTVGQMKFFVDRTMAGAAELTETQRRFQVTPGSATIHWLVGHVGFAIDRISLGALEVAPGQPDRYQPLFGWSTKPDGTHAGYPPWDQSVADLHQAIERLRTEVAARTEADLAKPLPSSHPFAKMISQRGAIVSFTAMHTAYHLGQVSLLRRAQGLGSGMGV